MSTCAHAGCSGDHPGCVFGGGSLGCVTTGCTNPHHRPEWVGARAPAAARLALPYLTDAETVTAGIVTATPPATVHEIRTPTHRPAPRESTRARRHVERPTVEGQDELFDATGWEVAS